jgi:hypothetical protein
VDLRLALGRLTQSLTVPLRDRLDANDAALQGFDRPQIGYLRMVHVLNQYRSACDIGFDQGMDDEPA